MGSLAHHVLLVSKISKIDYGGLLLFLTSSILVIYALTVGGFEYSWTSARCVLFVRTEIKITVQQSYSFLDLW